MTVPGDDLQVGAAIYLIEGDQVSADQRPEGLIDIFVGKAAEREEPGRENPWPCVHPAEIVAFDDHSIKENFLKV